jgi:hypothetical protein
MLLNENVKVNENSICEATKKDPNDRQTKSLTPSVKTSPSSPDIMSALMEEIRSGVALKKVEPSKHQPIEVMTNLMKALGNH